MPSISLAWAGVATTYGIPVNSDELQAMYITTESNHGIQSGMVIDFPEYIRTVWEKLIRKIDPAIPWHVSAFYPTFKMLDRPPTPASMVQQAREIGFQEGLRYVYMGNLPGGGGENTYCPACGEEIINRYGYRVSKKKLNNMNKYLEL